MLRGWRFSAGAAKETAATERIARTVEKRMVRMRREYELEWHRAGKRTAIEVKVSCKLRFYVSNEPAFILPMRALSRVTPAVEAHPAAGPDSGSVRSHHGGWARVDGQV